MNEIYKYLIKSKEFNEIILSLIDDKRIIFISDDSNYNEEKNPLIQYFNNFYLSNENFFEFKNNLLNMLSENCYLNEKYYINKLKVLNREIKNTTNSIINIFNCFIEKNDYGYSLNDLYNLTEKSIEFKDCTLEYYNILNKYNNIFIYDYNYVCKETNYLLEENLIEKFIKYKKFENNKKFNIINLNVEIDKIDYVVTKLSSILNNKFAFIPPLYFNEYTEDFIKEKIYYNNYSDKELTEIVKRINNKFNGELLDEIINYSKFNFKYLINFKEIKKENKEIYNKYVCVEKKIKTQYIENIENLDIYINSFKFIKKVFKEEVFQKLKSIILNEDEFYNYVLYLKNTLIVYKEYLSLMNKIRMISKFQYDILDYCYNNISTKSDLSKLIKFIPKYYLYLYIYNEEKKKNNIISKYKSVEKLLININVIIKNYSDLLINFLYQKTISNINKYILKNKIDRKELILEIKNDNTVNRYIELIEETYNLLLIDNSFYNHLISNRNFISHKKENLNLLIEECIVNYTCKINTLNRNDILLNTINQCISKILNNNNKCTFSEVRRSNLYVINLYNRTQYLLLYISNNSEFTLNDLIDLIEIRNKYKNIIFIWYRDWWLNRNEEIINLYKQINEYL